MRVASFCASLTPFRACAIALPKSLLPAPEVALADDVDDAAAPASGVPSGRRPARATAALKSKGLSRTSIMSRAPAAGVRVTFRTTRDVRGTDGPTLRLAW